MPVAGPESLLSIRSVQKFFPVRMGLLGRKVALRAVDGVSLEVRQGEVLGLVGESGCGKTTLGRLILRLLDPDSGTILFEDIDIAAVSHQVLKRVRRDIRIVFQDPFASLNPRMTVETIIGRSLLIHGIAKGNGDVKERVSKLLEDVGLRGDFAQRYPHEFSGGQRQRIAIANALATGPRFLVADEPTSALDVSVQAQILNLLKDLQVDHRLTMMFISHSISVIKHLSDRVAVMYLGKIMEVAPKDELFNEPLHPYTVALLSAVPVPNPQIRMEAVVKGEVPSAINPPSGCPFHPRCKHRMPKCSEVEPTVTMKGNRSVACFLHE